jgi:hypothetical protein
MKWENGHKNWVSYDFKGCGRDLLEDAISAFPWPGRNKESHEALIMIDSILAKIRFRHLQNISTALLFHILVN